MALIGRQPTAGDDAVDVRMVHQVRAPGVQDGRDAGLRPEMPFVTGNRQQCFCDTLEHQIVDGLFVLIRDCAQRLGQREDDVEVRDRQEIRPAGGEPTLGV